MASEEGWESLREHLMLTEASRSQPKAPSELTYLVCVYVFIVLHIHCTLAQKANLCELSTLPYISYIKGVSQASAAQQSSPSQSQG